MLDMDVVLVVIVTLPNGLWSCDNKAVVGISKTKKQDLVLSFIVNNCSNTSQLLAEKIDVH
jgi:hypothetical protein